MRLSELFENEMRGRLQCEMALYKNGRYCALGLLFKGKGFSDSEMENMWAEQMSILPMSWYRMTKTAVCSCGFKISDVGNFLTHLNDQHHMSFDKILEYIRDFEKRGVLQEEFQ